MKRYEHIYSTDQDDPEELEMHLYYLKRFALFLWLFVIGSVCGIVYYSEVNEFGYNVIAFMFRHGNFFGPMILGFCLYVIYQKVKR